MTTRQRLRHYLRLISLPLLLLVVTLSLRVLWDAFNLPPAPVLADIVARWLTQYGLPVLFLCAMAEGMLLVGGYFPGVFVITVSVIVARSWQEAAIAVTVGSAGLFAAHIVNYQLGRHGWYRLLARFGLTGAISDARRKLEKRGPIVVFSTYWMPSVSALTDTAAGVMGISFARFLGYSLLATIFWDTIAGVIMYRLGDKAIALATPNGADAWIVFTVLGAWMAGLLVWDGVKARKGRSPR